LNSAYIIKDTTERVIQPPRAYRQISEYINNIQTRENASLMSKRSNHSVQPTYSSI